MIKISFEEFVDEYSPVINKFNEDGYMFETFGEELEYVKKEAEKGHVWTLKEEGKNMFIEHGFHLVNILGYFITEYAPRFDGQVIVFLKDEDNFAQIIEQNYIKAKEAYDKALKAYKKLKRKEFLKETLSHIKDKELLEAIEAFGPIEAYPQADIFIYNGYRTWADSIVFKSWSGEEKAVVLDTDGDFDIDNISVYHKNDISIFFENEDGDELTNFHPELSYIPHVPELLEEVEVVK